MEYIKTPAPFSFDGHGINDAEGQRICKVGSCDPYIYPDGIPKRNPEFDGLSNLFAVAPEMFDVLKRIAETTCDHGPQEFCPRLEAEQIIAKAKGETHEEAQDKH
jgi:hypothetical protein